MSELITAYPTSELSTRDAVNILTAISDYINNIPVFTDFFTTISVDEDPNLTGDMHYRLNMTSPGGSFMTMGFHGTTSCLRIQNNTFSADAALNNSFAHATNNTSNAKTNNISVSYVTGINGTTALWLDNFSYETVMVFGKYDDAYFIANASPFSNVALYYNDGASAVNSVIEGFNGNNIGNIPDYICQPWYYKGINTKDIYTFDGGPSIIPYGKFNLGNAEFYKLTSNFALRTK